MLQHLNDRIFCTTMRKENSGELPSGRIPNLVALCSEFCMSYLILFILWKLFAETFPAHRSSLLNFGGVWSSQQWTSRQNVCLTYGIVFSSSSTGWTGYQHPIKNERQTARQIGASFPSQTLRSVWSLVDSSDRNRGKGQTRRRNKGLREAEGLSLHRMQLRLKQRC